MVTQMLPGDLQVAYAAFKIRCKEDGRWDDLRESDFDLFASDIETVSMAMPPTVCVDKQGDQITPNRPTRDHSSSSSNRKPGRTASPNDCWSHQFTGKCHFGDDCRNDHVGEPGADMLEVCDAQGRCLLELKNGICRRKNCAFGHSGDDSAPTLLPPVSKKPAGIMYPILPRRRAISSGDDCELYYIKQCPIKLDEGWGSFNAAY